MTRHIIVRDWETAAVLAGSDPNGVDLVDSLGRFLGRFIPEPQANVTEPHVVQGDGDPAAN